MARPPIELSVDQQQIVAVGNALKAEADGKILRRELIRELKALTPELIGELKAKALQIPSKLAHDGEPLRPAIAASIKPMVRLSGRETGLGIKSRKMRVRQFSMAARRFNREKVRETGSQVGDPGWFDDTLAGRGPELQRKVMAAIEATAARLAERTKGHIPE